MNSNPAKKDNVFFNRNFRLVFFGALVSELGALLYSFAVGFYILQISNNNAFLQGLYLALNGVTLLLFTPVGGVLGDRFNIAQIVILFVLGILGSIISGVFNPAAGVLLPHIVEEQKLQQANSYFSIKHSLNGIVGVMLAGILYAALPIHTLFFIIGACFIASGISETQIRYQHTPSKGQLTLRVALNDMRDGLNYLKTKKSVLALLGSLLFINFFFSPLGSNFIPYFVRTDIAGAGSYLLDKILTPELWSSVINVCIGIGSLAGAAILSTRKPTEKCGHTVAVCLCVIAALMISSALIYWLTVDLGNALNVFLIAFSAGCLVLGVMIAWINVPISTTMMRIVDRDKLSKVNSIMSMGSQGMTPLASVLAGAILQGLGSSVLLFICSLGFTVTALLALKSKSMKEL